MKLTAKFITAFILTALIPVAILGFLSYFSAKEALEKQVIDDLVLTAETKEGHLYSFMEAVKGRAADFSSDGFIRDKAKTIQKLEAKKDRCLHTQKALNTHLKHNKKTLDKSIRMISVIGLNGRVIASTDENWLGADESGDMYFVHGMKGIYMSDVCTSQHITTSEHSRHTQHIAVSAPLTDKRTGDPLGVIVNFYDTSVLNKILSGEFQIERGAPSGTLGRKETLDIYLVNKEKLLITPARFSGEVMQQKVESLPVLESVLGRETSSIYKNYHGGEVIGASMYVPSMGWTLLVEVSTAEAFLPVKSLRNRIIVLGAPIMMLAFFLAFLLSRESQSVIRESEERFKAFMDNSPAVAFTKDEEGCYVYINATFTRYFKITPENIHGKTDFEIWPMEIARRLHANDKSVLSAGKVMETYETVPTPDGILRNWLVFKFPVKDRSGRRYLGGVAIDVTERKYAEEELRKLSRAVEHSSNTIVITDIRGRIEYVNPKFTQLTSYTAEEALGQNPRILKSGKTSLEEYVQLWKTITSGGEWQGEFCNIKKNGESYWEQASISPVKNEEGEITHFIAIKEDITRRKQAERRLNIQHAVTRILAESSTFDEVTAKILMTICEGLEWDIGEMWEVDRRHNVLRCVEIWHLPSVSVPEFKAATQESTFSPGVGLPGRVWAAGEPVWISDVTCDGNFLRAAVAAKEGLRGAFCFPVAGKNEILGVMEFLSHEIRHPDEAILRMMAAVGRQIGLFLKRKQAEEQTRLQLQRLSALHDIDMAITGTFDIGISLRVFLGKVVSQLEVDAADILLLNRPMQILEYIAGCGFNSETIKHSCLRFGDGLVGKAVLEQRSVCMHNLREAKESFGRGQLIEDEAFVVYLARPFVTKGEVKGVLEIFHRTPLDPDQEWLKFLDILAGQGALAIDNALLFEDLQRSNMELTMAYDSTIEGWSRALDIRDEETEGHTRRVTEMTLRLAGKMGIRDDDLVHVRRGVLLHDIGKMGVPDSILLKPGPLTEEEWVVMRQHPVYAYAMLSPTAYLRPAVDIPYCHHEKWDGTGYPRGLKGEQIPLIARIFAVVDVWDALRSDRPYRKGCSEKYVRDYIRSQAGIHFDPNVVDVFLGMI